MVTWIFGRQLEVQWPECELTTSLPKPVPPAAFVFGVPETSIHCKSEVLASCPSRTHCKFLVIALLEHQPGAATLSNLFPHRLW